MVIMMETLGWSQLMEELEKKTTTIRPCGKVPASHARSGLSLFFCRRLSFSSVKFPSCSDVVAFEKGY